MEVKFGYSFRERNEKKRMAYRGRFELVSLLKISRDLAGNTSWISLLRNNLAPLEISEVIIWISKKS